METNFIKKLTLNKGMIIYDDWFQGWFNKDRKRSNRF